MMDQRRHRVVSSVLLLFLAHEWQVARIEAFVILRPPQFASSTSPSPFRLAATTVSAASPPPPSKVEDPDGPTPPMEEPDIPEVDPETVDGLRQIMRTEDLHVAVPGQPWRRGDTAGCDAPIHGTIWREKAERAIEYAVEYVGGKVLDVTWYLTVLLVTLDETVMPQFDLLQDRGALIEVQEPENPRYFDPDAPELPVITNDEDDVLYLDETEEETRAKADRRNFMYAPVDPEMGDDPNDPHIPDIDIDNTPGLDNEVRHVDQVIKMQEIEDNTLVEKELKYPKATFTTNTKALAVIGQAILDALEPYEEEWEILSRHELILTSPNPRPEIIETQKQFDAYRDHHVAVETYDPFGSNRILKGQLVDRNAMDLLLNIKGRLVTVPLNFVKCVRLPPQSSSDREYKEDEEDETEDDVEIVEAAAATKGDATLMP